MFGSKCFNKIRYGSVSKKLSFKSDLNYEDLILTIPKLQMVVSPLGLSSFKKYFILNLGK